MHFFNAPPTFSEDDLKEVLKRNSTSDPVRIRIFPIKPGARSAAGLIEYASVADASEVMVQSNHSIIKNPSKCVKCHSKYLLAPVVLSLYTYLLVLV